MIIFGICDDEKQYRNIIRKNLEDVLKGYEISYEIYEYSSGEEILLNYPKNIDILILDIQMKEISGMDTARKIREYDSNVEIIFMTSFSEFMQDGYEVNAYRYLLKPIDSDQFSKYLNDCINDIINSNKNYLTLNIKNSIDRIKVDSIIFVETQRPDLVIHTKDTIYNTKMSMRKMENLLKEKNFFRCHNSFLINLNKVESLNGENITLNNIKIPVSKHRIKNLKLAITNVLGDIVC